MGHSVRRMESTPVTLAYKALRNLGPLTCPDSPRPLSSVMGNLFVSQPSVYNYCTVSREGSSPAQTKCLLHTQAFPDPLIKTNGFLLSPSLLYFILFISFPNLFKNYNYLF